jgi:hypothetical protein
MMVIYEGGHPKPPLVFEGSMMRGRRTHCYSDALGKVEVA